MNCKVCGKENLLIIKGNCLVSWTCGECARERSEKMRDNLEKLSEMEYSDYPVDIEK
ncbi:hypothetical protein [Bacillus thuringiensis]|uniref:hypothetical protein n=1 Tax=Bacillus thuringiensis TaxID=1428 RepID=UPI002AB4019D|nr:hypothetical protein [Bacillus thuringiensis]MDY8165808.1 hypothetical protein [Bacillus thuringiensis]